MQHAHFLPIQIKQNAKRALVNSVRASKFVRNSDAKQTKTKLLPCAAYVRVRWFA